MNQQIQSVLVKIAALWNQNKITWGLGSSCSLYYHGIDVSPNDLDLFVIEEDVKKAKELLKSIGMMDPLRTAMPYLTEYFYEFHIDGVEVDLLSLFRISHREGVYEYLFSKDHIDQVIFLEGQEIPLIAIEDWYVLYQIMPRREIKVNQIEEYFRLHSPLTSFLSSMLEGIVPSQVRTHIRQTQNKLK